MEVPPRLLEARPPSKSSKAPKPPEGMPATTSAVAGLPLPVVLPRPPRLLVEAEAPAPRCAASDGED